MGIIESITFRDHGGGGGATAGAIGRNAESTTTASTNVKRSSTKENRAFNSNNKSVARKLGVGKGNVEIPLKHFEPRLVMKNRNAVVVVGGNSDSDVKELDQSTEDPDVNYDDSDYYRDYSWMGNETVNPLYEYRQFLWPTVKESDFLSFLSSDAVSWNRASVTHNHQSPDCNYTCHQQCSGMVTLNCKTQAAEIVEGEEENFEMKFEEPDFLYSDQTLRGENLKNKIEKFNSKSEEYKIEMQDDCETFHGFIRVQMNLSRPINVLAGTRPPSIYDIIYDEEEYAEKTLTSFYLPRDTVKAIHVTSSTTAQQLITALLKKFKVVDNPRKFRLYEKSWKGDGTMKGVLRRIQDHEKPLWLVMGWEDDSDHNHKFVLQENEIGDILWDAFTFPELNNFLSILEREEDEYINQVHKKYKYLQEKLQEAIDRVKTSTPTEPTDEPFTDM